MSGWRASDSSAPGTTTAGPCRPPWRRARFGLFGAWRDNTVSAGSHNRGPDDQLAAATLAFSLSAASAANGCAVLPRPPALRRSRPACADKDRRRGSGIRSRSRRGRRPRRSAPPARPRPELDLSAPAPRAMTRRWQKTRSIASSISFSIGSSVTTQVWPTVADTWPTTRRPPRPCGVDIERRLEARQVDDPGLPRNGGARPLDRREIEVAPGLGHFAAARAARSRDLRTAFALRHCVTRGHTPGTCSGAGKANLREGETLAVLDREPAYRFAYIGREPARRTGLRCIGIDVARKRRHQRLLIGCRQRRPVGRLPAIERLADPAHPPRHRKIAHAHFAHVVVHIAAEAIEQPLAELARTGAASPPDAGEETARYGA